MSEAPPTEPETSPPGRPAWIRRLGRAIQWTLAGVVALIAAAIMLLFTVDLGRFPQIKAQAERGASDYLGRPMRIGRLSALLIPGLFALDDVVIDGRRPGDRPFFRAGRIFVYVPWWTLFQRQLNVEVGVTDWQMTVETWADGHNLPRFMPRTRSTGPPRFTTTVRSAYANRGSFVFYDHVTPWTVTAPDLSFALVRAENLKEYVGRASFTGGSVQIQSFAPMSADMTMRFTLDGPRVLLRHVDLTTDGAVSHVNGFVDMSRWPEQTYNVNSTIDFARMRETFFASQNWRLKGEADFTGVFRFFRDGRELAGEFRSDDAVLNDLPMPRLHGSVLWTPDRFEMTHADSDLLDGHARFAFSIAPLRRPGGSTYSFSADYADLDLGQVARYVNLRGLELAGRTSGNISMNWPSGKFGTGRSGRGHTVIEPVSGMEFATEALPAMPGPPSGEPEPFDAHRPLTPLAVIADVDYTLEPGGWVFDNSWAATSHTFIRFGGRLASSGSSQFPFHVTSHDWQESDRLLARIMSAITGPTSAIQVGGRGTFDGEMTGTFSSPRIAGRFQGESLRVWDVTWGRGSADAVIAGGYVDITNGRFGDWPDAFITADGRFALGFRRDDAQEIDARVGITGWPMADLRHAFGLDEWSMEGTVAEVALTLTGRYRDMYGNGRVRVVDGMAWGERFDWAAGDIALEGSGMRVHRLEMQKSTGNIRGDAQIGWDGTYAFNADGEGVPVESLDSFKLEQAPLSGRLQFTASGGGRFESPTYTFRGSVEDLFAGDQGIGRVLGEIRIDGRTLMIERLVASSALLDVDGRGTISLNDRYDGNLHLRFTNSSLDPYLKFFSPELSPYARVILSGSLDVTGPLKLANELNVETTIDDATLTMFDYDLRNNGPVRVNFAKNILRVEQLRLSGTDTNLELTGGADLNGRAWSLSANGSASLSILQLVFPAITTSGEATLLASMEGSFDAPRLTGEAVLENGRLRPLASAHGIEALNGRIRFDESGINLDGVTGRVGGGDVAFGGLIAREGYRLTQYNLTAVGRLMRLRYPAGFNSTVNMDLQLLGPLNSPRLAGQVDVVRVTLTGGSDAGLVGLATAGTTGAGLPTLSEPGLPLGQDTAGVALDIEVTSPRIPLVATREARFDGSIDLRVSGTIDRPILTGAIQIASGEAMIAGNRVFIRESSIDFRNPDRVEPTFDVVADTRVRTTGQSVDISIHITGAPSSLSPTFTSDPPLPTTDILSLLVGGTPNLDTAQQRALASPQESQQQLMQTTAAFLLASPISSRVGEVFERTLALDTVQITPLLANEVAFQQLNPLARITLGKRISPRVFLTYARTLGNTAVQDEIILIEYDQNDRISWVLSRNENRTFALDFRIRYVR